MPGAARDVHKPLNHIFVPDRKDGPKKTARDRIQVVVGRQLFCNCLGGTMFVRKKHALSYPGQL